MTFFSQPKWRVIVLLVVCVTVGVLWKLSNRVEDRKNSYRLSTPTSIAHVKQRSGSPDRGRDHLLNSSYIDCGLPYSLFVSQMQEQNARASDVVSLKLPARTGSGQDLPYFNNLIVDKNGQKTVTNNCLTCHAAPLFGEIVVGLGNEFLDFTSDSSREVERLGLLLKDPSETAVWQRFADKIAVVAPYTITSTVGANAANNLTFALMAHRDPKTLHWSDDPLLDPPDKEVLPVSVPPWWRMAKKNAMFYQGQARGDHSRFMMTASLLCVDGVDDVAKTDAYAADIRAYIASLEPPQYPFPIDYAKIELGRSIFQSNCMRCHGDPTQPNGYPNLIIPLEEIGTDPELALQAAEDYQRFVEWSRQSWFGKDTDFIPLQGYMPPPLDGIWATAPFLHNGSVPTLEAVLDSKIRPAYWRHTVEREFDPNAVGWTYNVLSQGKSDELPHSENKWIYDTTQRGYSNSGHEFGDALTDIERATLIEFLKTL